MWRNDDVILSLQFHIDSRNYIPLIHTFDLVTDPEVGVANVTQLTVTSDGLTLYALTPSKVHCLQTKL